MVYLVLILVVYLIARMHALGSRIDKLEERGKTSAVVGTPQQSAQPGSVAYAPPRTQNEFDNALRQAIFTPAEQTTAASSAMNASHAGDRFIAWLKEDWIIKLGAFLLLIGFGWLTTYAFLNNWIGPMGRITLGIAAGACILLLGFWRIQKYIHQGGIFLVLGSTTILLTLFAARQIYDFFTPASALALMFLTTALVAFASVRYRVQTLALASITLAALAPLFTNSPRPDYESLFIYLFIVTLGAIWIVALTGWRALTTAALVLISLYSLPHLMSFVHLSDYSVLLLLAFAFSALFFITNTIGILHNKDGDIKADLVTAAGNGLFLLAWILAVGPDEWKSLLISGWMLIFTIGAFLIFKATARREPFYVYAGVAIAMLGAATAQEVQGATLTFFFTIESVAIVLISHSFLNDFRASEKLSFLLALPMLLSGSSVSSYAWATGILHKDFFVLLLLSAASLVFGLLFSEWQKKQNDDKSHTSAVFYIIGSLYAYVLIWQSFHALLTPDTAVMLSLIFYTCIGIFLYVSHQDEKKSLARMYGGLTLGFVILRLLTVDIWNMDITGKIVTFFLIGALLMSTAFIGRKQKQPVP